MKYPFSIIIKMFGKLDRLNRNLVNFVNFVAGYGKAVERGYRSNALAPIIWLDVFAINERFGFTIKNSNTARLKYKDLIR